MLEADRTTTVFEGTIPVECGTVKGIKHRYVAIGSPRFYFSRGESPKLTYTILPKKRQSVNAVIAVLAPFALILLSAVLRCVFLGVFSRWLFFHSLERNFHQIKGALVTPVVMAATYAVLNFVSYRRIELDLTTARSIIMDSVRLQIAILSNVAGIEAWISVSCGKSFQRVVDNLAASGGVSIETGTLVNAERFKRFLVSIVFILILLVVSIIAFVIAQ